MQRRRSIKAKELLSRLKATESGSLRSSSSELESDSCFDSGSDDDVLECVSLLFQEEEVDELDNDESYEQRDSGTVVARIIPKDLVSFEEKKNTGCRRHDQVALRSMLEDAGCLAPIYSEIEGPFPLKGESSNSTETVVSLEVHLRVSCKHAGDTKRYSESPKQRHFYMRMTRNAQEPARRTLRRLHLSIARRMKHDSSMGHRLLLEAVSHQEENAKRLEPLTTEPSIWVRESAVASHSSSSYDNTHGSTKPSRRLDWCKSPSQRRFCWKYAALLPSTLPGKEMQSDCLWNELANFDFVHLYLGINQIGPLLRLEVDACPPTILRIQTFEDFQSRLFVGVPLVVQLGLLHTTRALVAWFKEDEGGHLTCCNFAFVLPSDMNISYTPSLEDIGLSISILVVPFRPFHDGKGCEEAYKFHFPVEALPSLPIISPLRDRWTGDLTRERSEHLRVVTYNLLADWYAGRSVEASCANRKGSGTTKQHTDGNCYSFCKADFLMKSRRFPLLVHEILSYQPDVVCLQEVDKVVFDLLLLPVLRTKGYQGYYSNKSSVQQEGCAMFWSLQRFDIAQPGEMHEFHLCDFFRDNQHRHRNGQKSKMGQRGGWEESMSTIERLLWARPGLRDVVTSKVGQVLQVARLHPRHADGTFPQSVVVGNTHLFYHPMADHIRVIQAYQVCYQLDMVRRAASTTAQDVPLILCGDLNSHPLSGAVQLLLQGSIGPDHFEAWKNLNEYCWEMGGEDFLLDHGYIGNSQDDENDPTYIDEAFEDAIEDLFEDSLETSASMLPAEASETSTSDPQTCCSSVLDIQFPASFPKLLSGYPEMPEFTNYSVDFAETLDYILVSQPNAASSTTAGFLGLEPAKAAPVPTLQNMQQPPYAAMPNEFMPSDHVSLVCDLAWKCPPV